MHALLLFAALSAASATPLRDSVERAVQTAVTDVQASGVPGFEDVKKPKKEKFFGATNLLTGAFLGASAWYDVKTTYELRDLLGPDPKPLPNDPHTLVGVHIFPQPDGSTRVVTVTVREKTKFYRASVLANDRGSTWRRKAYVNAPIWVASHYLRRSPHKVFRVGGWLIPLLTGGIQVGAGVGNQRQSDRIELLLH